MGKLYDIDKVKDLEVGTIISNGIPVQSVDISEEIQDAKETLNLATEALTDKLTMLDIVTGATYAVNTHKIATEGYFNTVSNYQTVIKSISDNFGIKSSVPAMEDFHNGYSTNACHAIAMEGFFDYIKKIWDKIKDIFRTFFKKVAMFFRRLVGAELDLESYEKYLSKLMIDIRSRKLEIQDNTVEIESKLPRLLAESNMTEISTDYLLANMSRRALNFSSLINYTYNDKLKKLANTLSTDTRRSINTLLTSTTLYTCNPPDLHNNLKATLQSVRSLLLDIFRHPANSANVPSEMLDKLEAVKDDYVGAGSPYVGSLVFADTYSDRLPKNFNGYMGMLTSDQDFPRIVLYASVEDNGSISSKVKPIGNRDNLLKAYEDYKKLRSEVDMKKISSVIADLDDAVDYVIDEMAKRLPSVLDSLHRARTERANKDANDDYKADETAMLMNLDEINAKIDQITRYQKSVSILLASIQNLIKTLSTNMSGTYTELRFAIAKYLYDCGRLYA